MTHNNNVYRVQVSGTPTTHAQERKRSSPAKVSGSPLSQAAAPCRPSPLGQDYTPGLPQASNATNSEPSRTAAVPQPGGMCMDQPMCSHQRHHFGFTSYSATYGFLLLDLNTHTRTHEGCVRLLCGPPVAPPLLPLSSELATCQYVCYDSNITLLLSLSSDTLWRVISARHGRTNGIPCPTTNTIDC